MVCCGGVFAGSPAAGSTVSLNLKARDPSAPLGSVFAQSLNVNVNACRSSFTGPTGTLIYVCVCFTVCGRLVSVLC